MDLARLRNVGFSCRRQRQRLAQLSYVQKDSLAAVDRLDWDGEKLEADRPARQLSQATSNGASCELLQHLAKASV